MFTCCFIKKINQQPLFLHVKKTSRMAKQDQAIRVVVKGETGPQKSDVRPRQKTDTKRKLLFGKRRVQQTKIQVDTEDCSSGNYLCDGNIVMEVDEAPSAPEQSSPPVGQQGRNSKTKKSNSSKVGSPTSSSPIDCYNDDTDNNKKRMTLRGLFAQGDSNRTMSSASTSSSTRGSYPGGGGEVESCHTTSTCPSSTNRDSHKFFFRRGHKQVVEQPMIVEVDDTTPDQDLAYHDTHESIDTRMTDEEATQLARETEEMEAVMATMKTRLGFNPVAVIGSEHYGFPSDHSKTTSFSSSLSPSQPPPDKPQNKTQNSHPTSNNGCGGAGKNAAILEQQAMENMMLQLKKSIGFNPQDVIVSRMP